MLIAVQGVSEKNALAQSSVPNDRIVYCKSSQLFRLWVKIKGLEWEVSEEHLRKSYVPISNKNIRVFFSGTPCRADIR